MSASNWAICPRCVTRATRDHDSRLADVMATYGTVPVEEFDRARSQIKEVDPEDYRTFREDYEIYGATDGVVTVDYGGSCSTCGLSLSFKDDHPLNVREA
jgi:hypothetical protein